MPTTEMLPSGPLDVMTPEEALAEMQAGRAVLIDVRTPAEFAFEHIRGSLLMPLASFDPHALPAQDGKRIVFFCGSGIRSKLVAEALMRDATGPAAHIGGGITAWKRAGLPFIATDPQTGAMRDVQMQP